MPSGRTSEVCVQSFKNRGHKLMLDPKTLELLGKTIYFRVHKLAHTKIHVEMKSMQGAPISHSEDVGQRTQVQHPMPEGQL